MPWTRRLFWFSGIYGLVVILPRYFLESRIGRDDPPAITHPEYFYGFIGVALVWQLVYITIGADPLRYRPIMLLAALAKFSFAAAVAALYALGRVAGPIVHFVAIDFVLGVLFLVAFIRLSRMPRE